MVSLSSSMSRLLLFPLALVTLGFQTLAADDAIPRATELLRSLPMVFEPNAGRWESAVKFAARTSDYRVLLSARGARLEDSYHVVSISPVNANPTAKIAGDSELPFRTGYFLGSNPENWRRGVANYGRVR